MTAPQRIKSISFNQGEVLRAIVALHTGDIECDVTYGSGCFYSEIQKPALAFDISPSKPGVVAADVRSLPLKANSVSSVMFDPPFLLRTGAGAILKERFSSVVGSMADLWRFYLQALRDICRVLKPDGWLVFKCQDGVLSGKNWFTHVEVCKMCEQLGLAPVDLFILLATHRMTDPTHTVQKHARKYHSYFWVFQKRSNVRYITWIAP